jgi:hypothetical protein
MGENKSKQMVNPWHSKNSNGKSLAESVNEIINDNTLQAGDTADENSTSKSRAREWKKFTALLEDYTGVKGQGAAVWIPTEVKKRIEFVRANAKTNIPIRALAAAMIVAFIDEHRNELKTL